MGDSAQSTAPEVNRAVVYAEPGTTKTAVKELPIPTPGPGEVLVRLSYSGVCHTDYGFCTLSNPALPVPTAPDQIGGHEGVGQIIAQGPGVTSPAVGSYAGIGFTADACLSCDRCLVGGESSCVQAKISGYYTAGTFQQYCIASARYVTPIPEEAATGGDLAGLAPLMCGGVSVYAALRRAGAQHGDWVLVTGAGGGLGHFAIQYARVLGCRVVAVDGADKEGFCRGLGAEAFLDYRAHPAAAMREAVHRVTAGGARVVLACTSSRASYEQSPSWLAFRGTVVALGVPDNQGFPFADPGDLVVNELRILGIKTANRLEAKEAIAIAAKGLVKAHYQTRKMEDVGAIFEEMEEGKLLGRAVIDLR